MQLRFGENFKKSAKIITLLCCFSFFGLGCSKDKKSNPAPVEIRKVTGDPITFVKGTQTNGDTSGLPENIFVQNERWDYGILGFVEEKLKSYDEQVKEQTPSENESDATYDSYYYTIKYLPNGLVALQNRGRGVLEFQFRKNSDRLWVIDDLYENQKSIKANGQSFKVIHYSTKPDLSAISLLLYIIEGDKKALLNFHFEKVGNSTIDLSPDSNSSYNYFYGKGVKVKWNQNQKNQVTFCNIQEQSFRNTIKSGISAWKSPLKGRLEVEVIESTNCPPFSDLNHHGIYWVDDWIEILGDSGVLGSTQIVADFSKKELIDSDIFYMKGEIKEALQLSGQNPSEADSDNYYSRWYVQSMFKDTSTHEFGHFLGLHHIFDGTHSVMSYNDEDDGKGLHKYDVEAIQALYPLMNN